MLAPPDFPVAQQGKIHVAQAASHPPASQLEADVQRARGLMEKRQFAQALILAQDLLVQVPENRDVLYVVAVNQRGARRACRKWIGR